MTAAFRFAPSPTGFLHIGNARTALFNALLARKRGGRFILRLDDTDRERSTEAFARAIVEDLTWLGLTPDAILRQSDRLDRYVAALERLKAQDAVYPAYETPEELDRRRRRQQALGRPPVYDRAALRLTQDERAHLEREGRRPHWRFKLSGERVAWDDGVRGESHIETGSLSDPVLVREDGTFLYTFASVVDDIELSITDVVRGEDHVANTAVQIEIFAALGAHAPRFAHHNLIASATGEEMSKRTGALSLRSFREAGADPLAVAAVAVLTGTADAVRLPTSLDDLAGLVDLAKVSRALTKFDPAEIVALSLRALHQKPFAEVAGSLAQHGVAGPKAEAFWLAIRSVIGKIEEAADWWALLMAHRREISADQVALDETLRSAARDLLPPEPWGEGTWQTWTDAVKRESGRGGKALFLPLRLALTGRAAGPELKAVLPLLGRDEVLARLRAPSS